MVILAALDSLKDAAVQETLGDLLAAGNVAEVFEWGSDVVKLYRSKAAKRVAFREAAIHATIEAMRLPVPDVLGVQQIGDRWGIVFKRVNQASFADRMSDVAIVPRYLEILARLHTRIHTHTVKQFSSLKIRVSENISKSTVLRQSKIQALLRSLAEMPDGERLCHGDFHPMNVLGDATQPIIIDWPDAARGDPAADVCRSYLLMTLYARDLADPYIDAYCRLSGIKRSAIVRWLPYMAASRLSENVGSESEKLLQLIRMS